MQLRCKHIVKKLLKIMSNCLIWALVTCMHPKAVCDHNYLICEGDKAVAWNSTFVEVVFKLSIQNLAEVFYILKRDSKPSKENVSRSFSV